MQPTWNEIKKKNGSMKEDRGRKWFHLAPPLVWPVEPPRDRKYTIQLRTQWRCLYSPSLPVLSPMHNVAKKTTKTSFCVPITYHNVVYLITRLGFFYRFWFYTGRWQWVYSYFTIFTELYPFSVIVSLTFL